jgi:uncharacterized protein (DUF4415 family)
MKRTLIRNTPEEETAVQRGIALDPDNPELTDEDWATARPMAEAMPRLVEQYLRSRGRQKMPTKVLISLRLDRDVVETLRASGRGWQGRVNEMLKKSIRGSS